MQRSIVLSLVSLLLVGIAAAAKPFAPEITAETWLNTKPLTMQALRGNVVLVEFWTYGCWNCKNVEPFIKQWHNKYESQGLVVLAVHSPEFRHERDIENVKRYISENDITYPVPIDNDFSAWQDFGNRAWPTVYLIDKGGRIVYSHIGEGAYSETEAKIAELVSAPADAT
jgi:thiol-disulfide isomerase/thioredoxin